MDHIGIPITNARITRDFYAACLVPLGWRLRGFSEGRYVGFDRPGEPVLYFVVSPTVAAVHLAFEARSHDAVRAFHTAALAADGTDNGPPGPRPHYSETYFAAFVLDPDGHNIEAVFGNEHR